MRGRDAARKLTLRVNILQVFPMDFSEIQLIVNHNSQSDEQNKSAKSGTNLQKKTIHMVSLQRTTLNKSSKNGPMKFRSDFRAAVSMKNPLHHESGEQIEEPISPEKYSVWHPSSSTSWWNKNWKRAHKNFLKIVENSCCYSWFRLQSIAGACLRLLL